MNETPPPDPNDLDESAAAAAARTANPDASPTPESAPGPARNRATAGPAREIDPLDLLKEIEKLDQHSGSWTGALILLVVSMVLFAGAYSLSDGMNLGILIGVVFFHEMGHYVGMRLFGYRNLKMFFIPFLGAAVSGIKTHVDGWKEAVVSLLGPLPGIVMAAGMMVWDVYEPNDLVAKIGRLGLLLNVLNLVPMMPLDGGHFWRQVLFGRSPSAEGLFTFLTGAGLAAFSFFGGLWLLGGVGVLVALSGMTAYRRGKLARMLRPKLFPEMNGGEDSDAKGRMASPVPEFGADAALQDHGAAPAAPATLDASSAPLIPSVQGDAARTKLSVEQARMIRDAFIATAPNVPNRTAATMAVQVKDVWDRVLLRPPGLAASLALVGLYVGAFVLAVGTFFWHGHGHTHAMNDAASAGHLALEAGDASAALAHYRRSATHAARFPNNHDTQGAMAMNLGSAHFELEEWTQAEAQYAEAVVQFELAGGEEAPEVATALEYLGTTLTRQGREAEAAPIFERAERIREGEAEISEVPLE